MRRSEAARYARWSAAIALFLGGATLAVYVERAVVAKIDKRNAPPPAPKEVEKSLSGLTFSKVDANRTIFTVQASKSTDFRGQNASLLEEVQITIFGKNGERHDTVRTRSCQFDKAKGSIECSGDVRIELQSAADAERAKQKPNEPAQAVHVETSAVTFDRASGAAHTDRAVRFTFPNGTGEALGVDYQSEEGLVRLLRDVQMQLAAPGPGGQTKKPSVANEAVTVRGMGLDFGRDTRTMHLTGPAQVTTASLRLDAPKLTLLLDEKFRAEKLVAGTGDSQQAPVLRRQGAAGETRLSAQEMTALFSQTGAVERIRAEGSVNGTLQSTIEQDEVKAHSAVLEMLGRSSEPKQLDLSGGVDVKTGNDKTSEKRTLNTEALRVDFTAAEGKKSQVRQAETLAAGFVEWVQKDEKTGEETHTRVRADKFLMELGAEGKARMLQARGNVQTERVAAGRPVQTASAQNADVQLAPAGGWTQMQMAGSVRLQEGDRRGESERAVLVRAAKTATLTEKAMVRDGNTETHAPKIVFAQDDGGIHAEGGVRTTDLGGKGSTVQLGASAANITADRLEADSRNGRAVYRGHARFWQGDAVLEANAIELQRATRTMTATGSVRGVLPGSAGKAVPGASVAKKNGLWHISAETLVYHDGENKAQLEKNVTVESGEQRMRGAALDLYFTKGGASETPEAAGARQISRAVGTGGVTVEQGQRRATAERGEYTASDGKFVMSGGQPTIYDGSEGTTTGRQLTFFLADDTIIVDSENGSRTLTKHRVEK